MRKIFIAFSAFVFFASPSRVAAQTAATEARQSLDQFRQAWRDAWTRRDLDALEKLQAEDFDWVTADGTWLKGRAAFRAHHERLFARNFSGAQWSTFDEKIELVDPTLAIEIRATRIEGDTYADGRARAPRRSIGTRVYVRKNAQWLLQASHNTIIAPLP